ncbi:uncharacterized protein ARMOST_06797 [Armillaria ostoyae]|uniref:Uncharacterized protein n=1 Tax=Armillaria ostoyae TaxID=47428 RepID=A0A284R3Y4_ARMOS|nr:uncharacterized protein ARMOST_06797 [Armillaria ostoyae]
MTSQVPDIFREARTGVVGQRRYYVAGVVSARILIGSGMSYQRRHLVADLIFIVIKSNIMNYVDSQDKVDIDHWQTNFFATPPGSQPMFGKFGGTHGYNDSDASSTHTYIIDCNQDRISWSVDGDEMQNAQKSELPPFCVLCFDESIAEDSMIGGQTYYLTHDMRTQMGIWDASGEAGSASWAKGRTE